MTAIPFDIHQRYRGILRSLEPFLSEGRVLDVGGANGAATALAPPRLSFVVADIGKVESRGGVRADAAALPFRSESFDAVVSADLLEHVAGRSRAVVLREMLRVARGAVIVAAPFHDPRVSAAEESVDALVRTRLGMPHPALAEHREHGLPDLRATVSELGAKDRWTAVAPNGSLRLWLPLMLTDWYLADDAALAPLRERLAEFYDEVVSDGDAAEPAYRHLVTSVPASMAPRGSSKATSPGPALEQEVDWDGIRALLELFRIDSVRSAESARDATEERAARSELEARSLRSELGRVRAHIRDLEDSLRLHAEELVELRAFRSRFTDSAPGRAWRRIREHGR